jgi:hypothetical protein
MSLCSLRSPLQAATSQYLCCSGRLHTLPVLVCCIARCGASFCISNVMGAPRATLYQRECFLHGLNHDFVVHLLNSVAVNRLV